MLRQDAFSFGKAISDLWLMENICDRSADLPMDDEQIRDTRQKVSQVLEDIKGMCAAADLADRIGPEIGRFERALVNGSLKELAGRCDHLRERLLDELETEFYFRILRDDVQYYGQRAPFGDIVAAKFEAATGDIEQAARCLALQQPTACVFHLMRAMEIAVRRLARKSGMTITPQTTWRQLTGNMDGQIRRMGERTAKQKQRKNDWEAARVNLHHLGSVLRNNTMHPAAVYTQNEAKHIFNTVSVIFKALCKL
jgi:hypothetical protein